jgi:dienelactone hydrolase
MLAGLQGSAAPAGNTPDALSHGRAVLASIAASEFEKIEAEFTPDMKAALPPGRLAAIWANLLAQAGALQGCGQDARLVEIGGKQMVITPCEFERARIDVQFAFDGAGKISGFVMRPAAKSDPPYTLPAYADPASYSEQPVTIGSGEWALPATLTLPAGAGPSPAVILVHGSGPNDRDETVGASKPFKDLAFGLASRGIAVLRYDKRTKVHAAAAAARKDFTVQHEVVDDVIEAVKTLRAHRSVDPTRVFVLGHSLGGMLVPRIWRADSTIAGLIVMAGPARPLEDAIVAQTRYLAESDGTISPEERAGVERAAALADQVRALQPQDAAGGRAIAGAPASYWLDLRGYDPSSAAVDVKAPMLILHGGRDYQVTAEEFARWKTALGSRPDVTFRSYPALNHLFIAGAGPSLPAEYLVAGHVAEEVIVDIAAWIRATPR